MGAGVEMCVVESSPPHGHVQAILDTVGRLGLDDMIASKPCRERDIVVGMIAERLVHGTSKLAAEGCVQLSLFDEKNPAEVRSPEYPGERPVVCYNP